MDNTLTLNGVTYKLVEVNGCETANPTLFKDVWVNVYFNALKIHPTYEQAMNVAGGTTRGTRKVRIWANGNLDVLE
jgi:hypothetical protein